MYQQGYNEVSPNYYNYDNGREMRSAKYGNRLKVFGRATVNVKPDIAEISIGVITENKQLKQTQKENTKITQQVVDSIKSMGILAKDIQTQNYNIREKNDYIDGEQVFRGYEVTNYLKVVVKNINHVGEIIDTAVKNGANTVDNIRFIVSDASKYYAEALRLAIEDAQNKALVMGNKLRVKVNNVPIEIIEQGGDSIAPLTVMTFKATSGSTPIEAGENKITAVIEGMFIYDE